MGISDPSDRGLSRRYVDIMGCPQTGNNEAGRRACPTSARIKRLIES